MWPPSSQIQGLAFTTSVKLTHTYSELCLWRASVNSESHISRHWGGGGGRAGLGLRLSLDLQSQLSLDAIMKCVHVLPHLSFLPGFCHLVEDGLDERRAGLSTRAQTYRPCPMCSLLDTDGCHPTHSTGASQKLDMHAGHASWRHELTASSDTARGIVQAKIDTYLIKLLINGSVLNNMLQHARLRNHPA